MDEFDGICAACGREWRLQLHPYSEPVRTDMFRIMCPYCQVTAPRAMKVITMKRTELAIRKVTDGPVL